MNRKAEIIGIELYKADFELIEPFRTSLAEITCAHNIIVRIYSSDGLYGTGEARPNIAFADLDGHRNMKSDPVTGGARYEGGAIMLSEEPGHGADYEREFLTQCPCASVE